MKSKTQKKDGAGGVSIAKRICLPCSADIAATLERYRRETGRNFNF